MNRPDQVSNDFIDESVISPHGIAIPYEKSDFSGSRIPKGVEVKELTWEEAGHYFEGVVNGSKASGVHTPAE